MDHYNLINVEKHFTSFLKQKLLDTISLMIINKKTSESFIYIENIEKFSSIFNHISEYFNCDINFTTTKHIDGSKVYYECKLDIRPSNEHLVKFIKDMCEHEYTPFGEDAGDGW